MDTDDGGCFVPPRRACLPVLLPHTPTPCLPTLAPAWPPTPPFTPAYPHLQEFYPLAVDPSTCPPPSQHYLPSPFVACLCVPTPPHCPLTFPPWVDLGRYTTAQLPPAHPHRMEQGSPS